MSYEIDSEESEDDRNEENCFLYALKELTDIFKSKEHKATFKNMNLSLQFRTANMILEEHGKELVQIREAKGYLENFLKTSLGYTMVAFYSDEIEAHAEGLFDGNVIDIKRNGIKPYLDEILTMKEYIIVVKKENHIIHNEISK